MRNRLTGLLAAGLFMVGSYGPARAFTAQNGSRAPRLIFVGPPGSGKTTFARRLSIQTGAVHIGASDLLAEYAKTEPNISEIMRSGALVPAEVVIKLVTERLQEPDVQEKGFILEGFPRRLEEAEAFLAMDASRDVDAVVHLDVSKEELWRRIEKRGRSDDTRETFEKRMGIYEAETMPVYALLMERYKFLTPKTDGVDLNGAQLRIEKLIAESALTSVPQSVDLSAPFSGRFSWPESISPANRTLLEDRFSRDSKGVQAFLAKEGIDGLAETTVNVLKVVEDESKDSRIILYRLQFAVAGVSLAPVEVEIEIQSGSVGAPHFLEPYRQPVRAGRNMTYELTEAILEMGEGEDAGIGVVIRIGVTPGLKAVIGDERALRNSGREVLDYLAAEKLNFEIVREPGNDVAIRAVLRRKDLYRLTMMSAVKTLSPSGS